MKFYELVTQPYFITKVHTFIDIKLAVHKHIFLQKDVRPEGVTLKDGTVIPCGLVVWSTGLAPRYFTRGVDLPKNERGQVSFAKYLATITVNLISNHTTKFPKFHFYLSLLFEF